MKRIAFITVHVGPNFGSNLQSIATSYILKKMGYKPLLINYIPQRVTYSSYINKMFTSISLFVRGLVLLPKFIINNKIYNKYLSKNCELSRPIYNNENFAIKCPKADIYITGSDQVWNSKYNEGLDTHYYFGGIKGEKVAFASSFGMTELPENEFYKVKELLNDYKAISLREKSAVKIVESMGYEATHVLDPTFMLNKSDWEYYMSKRLIKENYILMYLPYNIKDKDVIYKTARKIAKKEKLKIITFSWNYFKDKYADKTMRFCNPGDFLSLMYYADYVITNSFHGTAFSINLNKQFWVYMPSGYGTRITSIIELCGLEVRVLDREIEDKQILDKINYDNVNFILEQERNKVIEFLKKSLD